MPESEKGQKTTNVSDSETAAAHVKIRKPFHGFRLEKVERPEGVNDFQLDLPPGCLADLCTGITAEDGEKRQ